MGASTAMSTLHKDLNLLFLDDYFFVYDAPNLDYVPNIEESGWLDGLSDENVKAVVELLYPEEKHPAEKQRCTVYLKKMVGKNSAVTDYLRKGICQRLWIIFHALSRENLTPEQEQDNEIIRLKLIDGIDKCAEGLYDRAEDCKFTLERPTTIQHFLTKIRKNLVIDTFYETHAGANEEQNVHVHGRFFALAEELGLGLQRMAELANAHNAVEDIKALITKFNERYQLFSILNQLRETIKDELARLGYNGYKTENEEYAYPQYSKFLTLFKTLLELESNFDISYLVCEQVGDEIDECFKVRDLNWNKINGRILDRLISNKAFKKDISFNPLLLLAKNLQGAHPKPEENQPVSAAFGPVTMKSKNGEYESADVVEKHNFIVLKQYFPTIGNQLFIDTSQYFASILNPESLIKLATTFYDDSELDALQKARFAALIFFQLTDSERHSLLLQTNNEKEDMTNSILTYYMLYDFNKIANFLRALPEAMRENIKSFILNENQKFNENSSFNRRILAIWKKYVDVINLNIDTLIFLTEEITKIAEKEVINSIDVLVELLESIEKEELQAESLSHDKLTELLQQAVNGRVKRKIIAEAQTFLKKINSKDPRDKNGIEEILKNLKITKDHIIVLLEDAPSAVEFGELLRKLSFDKKIGPLPFEERLEIIQTLSNEKKNLFLSDNAAFLHMFFDNIAELIQLLNLYPIKKKVDLLLAIAEKNFWRNVNIQNYGGANYNYINNADDIYAILRIFNVDDWNLISYNWFLSTKIVEHLPETLIKFEEEGNFNNYINSLSDCLINKHFKEEKNAIETIKKLKDGLSYENYKNFVLKILIESSDFILLNSVEANSVYAVLQTLPSAELVEVINNLSEPKQLYLMNRTIFNADRIKAIFNQQGNFNDLLNALKPNSLFKYLTFLGAQLNMEMFDNDSTKLAKSCMKIIKAVPKMEPEKCAQLIFSMSNNFSKKELQDLRRYPEIEKLLTSYESVRQLQKNSTLFVDKIIKRRTDPLSGERACIIKMASLFNYYANPPLFSLTRISYKKEANSLFEYAKNSSELTVKSYADFINEAVEGIKQKYPNHDKNHFFFYVVGLALGIAKNNEEQLNNSYQNNAGI